MASKKIFHSILFPVDFSEANESIVPHVRGIAELTGASVMLLHVIPWLPNWYGERDLHPEAGESYLWKLEEQCALELEIFRERHFSSVPSYREIKSGPVAETITNTAIDWGSDLIMMPTRGQGRNRRFLIGSTTAKVLHDTACPVWTSPHLGTLTRFTSYKNLLCAVDRETIPAGYLEEALRLASGFGSRLTFVTAMPRQTGQFGEAHEIQSVRREFPQANLREEFTPPACKSVTAAGSVGEVVRRIAEGENADLVIADRAHMKQSLGRLRTHSYEIVLESPCPVLSTCASTLVRVEEEFKAGTVYAPARELEAV